jgi:hypothetical protein
MVHGNRDYFNSMPLSTMYSMIDAAELAARLGSIDNFDRRGNVLWLTGFEEGIAEWKAGGKGTGYSVSVSTDRAYSGGYSCKLVPGSTTTYEASISRYQYLPPSTRIGFEYAFLPSTHLSYIYSRIFFYKNGYLHDCRIRYDNVNKNIDYWTGNNTYTPLVTNVDLTLNNPWWSIFKWVYDLDKGEYVRLIWNHTEQDMKGLTPVITPSPTRNNMYYDIGIVQSDGGQGPTYIDNVILTINE